MAIGLSVLAAAGVSPAGVGIDSVAVPIGQVAIPVDKAVVSLASVTRCAKSDPVPSLADLVARVRDVRLTESERLAALEKIRDQDAIFYLFFKPGEDRNLAVRVAAVNRISEVDVLKALGEKTPIPEIRKAASSRLETVYADRRDRAYVRRSAVVQAYLERMRSRR